MNNSKAFGKMVEMEEKYKSEQKKVNELEQQLQQVSFKNKTSGESFQLDLETIMEINYK